MFRGYLLLFELSIFACFVACTVARQAIVGGIKAVTDQFPYQVSLLFHGHGHGCGGAIIDELHILTAAHCVVKDGHIDKTPISILAGTNDLQKTKKPAAIIPVKKIYVPKYYKRAVGAIGDISVLLLDDPLEFSKHIWKVDLPRNNMMPYTGMTAEIAGFGWDRIKIVNGIESGDASTPHLQFAEAHILGDCILNHRDLAILEKLLCAKIKQRDAKQPHGVCHGDSGGPLVIQDDLVIGILSFGPTDCNERDSVAIYTRVSKYLEFIGLAVDDQQHEDIITHVMNH